MNHLDAIADPVQVSPPTAQAVSWLLAARLLRALPGYRIGQRHPGDGQYDLLVLARDARTPVVMLNRHGRVHVQQPDGTSQPVTDEGVWAELAGGHRPVDDVARRILEELGAHQSPREPAEPAAEPAQFVADVIAELLRISALYGGNLSCVAAYHDSSGMESSFWRREHLRLFPTVPVPVDATDPGPADRDRYWLLLRGQEPVAVLDTAGSVHRRGLVPHDLLADAAQPPATTVAGDLFPLAELTGGAGGAPRPGLGLSAVLEAFNRKERYYLLAAATAETTTHEIHGPALRLTARLRAQLEEATGWPVPAHAWIGMDYHLAWLHAALQWRCGRVRPGQTDGFPARSTAEGQALVSGDQEDADLIVAWSGPAGDKVILVEGKAYGPWGNAQFGSKVRRIQAIVDQLPTAEPGHEAQVKLVLASPRRPQQLVGIPDFATAADGGLAWIPLPLPGARLATARTDAAGRLSGVGEHWKITGPAARPR